MANRQQAEEEHNKGVEACYAGAYEIALTHFLSAIDLYPHDAAPHNGLGNVYHSFKQYTQAMAAYQRAIQLAPLLAVPHYGLGNVYYSLKQYPQAIAAYQQAMELDSLYASPHNGLGNVYKALEQYQQAIAAYQQAIELAPHSAYPHQGLGNVYYSLKQYPQAIAAYQQAIELDSLYAAPHNGLGNVYKELKQYQQAIAAYQQAIDLDPHDAYPHNGLGNVYGSLKQYPEAIAAYQQAIRLDPHFAIPHNGLGNVYKELKQYPEAIAAYQQAIDLDPLYAYPHYGLGNVYKALEQYQQAIAAYQQAIRLDPLYASPHVGLGNVYYSLKQYPEAIAAYQQAIRLDPHAADTHYGLGNVYKELKQYPEAIAAYQQAIDLDPLYAYPHDGLGNVFDSLKQPSKALPAYFRSFYLEPEDYFNLILFFSNNDQDSPAFLSNFSKFISDKSIVNFRGYITKQLRAWSEISSYIDYQKSLNKESISEFIPQLTFFGGDPVSTFHLLSNTAHATTPQAYYYLIAYRSFEYENDGDPLLGQYAELASKYIDQDEASLANPKEVFYAALIQIEDTEEELALSCIKAIQDSFPPAKALHHLITARKLSVDAILPDIHEPYYLQNQDSDWEQLQKLIYVKALERTALFLGIPHDPLPEIWQTLRFDEETIIRCQVRLSVDRWKEAITKEHQNLTAAEELQIKAYLDEAGDKLSDFLTALNAISDSDQIEEKIGKRIQDWDFPVHIYTSIIYNNFIQDRLDRNQVFRLLFFQAEMMEKHKSGEVYWDTLKLTIGGAAFIPSLLPDFGYNPMFGFLGFAGAAGDVVSKKLNLILSIDNQKWASKDSDISYKSFCQHLDKHLNQLADAYGEEVFEKEYQLPALRDLLSDT